MYVKHSPLNSRSHKGPLTCSPRMRLHARLAVIPANRRTNSRERERERHLLFPLIFLPHAVVIVVVLFFLPFPNEKGGVFLKFSSVFFLTCCSAEPSTSSENDHKKFVFSCGNHLFPLQFKIVFSLTSRSCLVDRKSHQFVIQSQPSVKCSSLPQP